MEKCKNCGKDYKKPPKGKSGGIYRDLVAKDTCSIKCYKEYESKGKKNGQTNTTTA